MASTQIELIEGRLATKQDIALINRDITEIKRDITELKRDIKGLETRFERDIKELELRFEARISEVKVDLIKWVIGIAGAQAMLIIALFKLL